MICRTRSLGKPGHERAKLNSARAVIERLRAVLVVFVHGCLCAFEHRRQRFIQRQMRCTLLEHRCEIFAVKALEIVLMKTHDAKMPLRIEIQLIECLVVVRRMPPARSWSQSA